MKTETATPLLEGVAWAGRNLIAIDPDVVDKRIRRRGLSASTSKSMKGCLARFAADKLLPRPSDPFLDSELGTSTHSIIEDLYNLPAAERVKTAFEHLRDTHADKKWDIEKLAESTLAETGDEWSALKARWSSDMDRLGAPVFDIENPAETTVFKTEMSFEDVKIAGVPAMGFIDRVDVVQIRGRDRLKVVDLKTGKMKSPFDLRRYGDDHGDQIRLYSEAVREVTGEAAAIGEIHYTQFGTSREIPLTELAVEKTRNDFREGWDTHNLITDSGVFPTKAGPLCGWCPLVNSCPAAAAAGKTASDRAKETPKSAVELGIPTVRSDTAGQGSKLPVTDPIVRATKAAPGAESRVIAAAPAYIPNSDEAPPVDPFGSTANSSNAAHVTADKATSTGTDNTPMSNILFSEGKPWEATINGKLNGASYAAMAVVSVPQIAGELLVEAGRTLNGANIDRLTDLFAEIIVTVQKEVRGGEFNWDDGINTRIRGALRTTIETLPLPWDATSEDAWVNWQEQATKRTSVFIRKAIRLFESDLTFPATSFSALLTPDVVSIKPKPGAQKVA